jgi:hypothetical protein
MKIITGIKRRRRGRVEEKLPIVAEVGGAGAVISHMARHRVMTPPDLCLTAESSTHVAALTGRVRYTPSKRPAS